MTKVQSPPGPLQTERLPDGRRVLLRNLVVRLDDGTRITISAGFETDFSSLPWGTRWAIHWRRVDVAGVVHDFLYWCPQPTVSRRRADDIWREIAAVGQRHAMPHQAWGGWLALRVFGWKAYNRATKEREAGRGRICAPPLPRVGAPTRMISPDDGRTSAGDGLAEWRPARSTSAGVVALGLYKVMVRQAGGSSHAPASWGGRDGIRPLS